VSTPPADETPPGATDDLGEMPCPNCGARVPEGEIECPQCGSEVAPGGG
jgi:DNA-directed RNA polymerase subunit RPC12/RpoP